MVLTKFDRNWAVLQINVYPRFSHQLFTAGSSYLFKQIYLSPEKPHTQKQHWHFRLSIINRGLAWPCRLYTSTINIFALLLEVWTRLQTFCWIPDQEPIARETIDVFDSVRGHFTVWVSLYLVFINVILKCWGKSTLQPTQLSNWQVVLKVNTGMTAWH